jgi:predicted GNAT family acetyltransferase
MEFTYLDGQIALYGPDGALLAQITYPEREPGVVEIDHTFVDQSLRGQGMAGKLMEAAAAELRRSGRKAVPTCSYAAAWFEKHPEWADVLK